MTAVPRPDPEGLRRLIEERLGPIRAGEIEVHVEAGPPGQDRLERLTVRRAWDLGDRATRKASSLIGQAPDAAEDEPPGSTDLEPADVHAAARKSVGLSSPTRIGSEGGQALSLTRIGSDRTQRSQARKPDLRRSGPIGPDGVRLRA